MVTANRVALAELERVSLYAQATKGLIPHWVPRPMLPHEVRAGVNFVAIDRSMRTGYASTAEILQTLQRALSGSLGRALAGAADRKVITARVAEWVKHPPRDVLAAKARAKQDMHAALVACAGRAGAELRAEAAHQGVLPRTVRAATPKPRPPGAPPITPALLPGMVDPFEDLLDEADLPVEALVGKVNTAAALAVFRAQTPDAAVTAADNVSVADALDLARQGVHVATGEGRAAALDELPEPTSIYASELLDDRVCDPCSNVDGTEYGSVDEAEADYPGQGAFIDCDGGARCRGSLVFIFNETP